MELVECAIPALNKFATDYTTNQSRTASFFDYNILHDKVYENRHEELLNREFPRKALVDLLLNENIEYGANDYTLALIRKLEDESSVVVVGGQQAGVLTGPLYTIHKIITIILLAKQQSKKLNVPVLPLFWIAGEDHDFDEINHIFYLNELGMKKSSIPLTQFSKKMASQIDIPEEKMKDWLHDIFLSFGETKHSKQLLSKIEACLKNSENFVDFFAQLINTIFPNEGLILLNSSSPALRQLEVPFFEQLIQKSSMIRKEVYLQQSAIEEKGFQPMIELREGSANVYYHIEGERLLLIEDEQAETFNPLGTHLNMTKEELVLTLHKNPCQFSNNVVTRPLMQESILPTLAFVGGPGEIHYWAELQKAFHLFDYKMPPLVPRVSFTLVERTVESDLQHYGLTYEEVVRNGSSQLDASLQKELNEEQVSKIVEETKVEILKIHNKLSLTLLEGNSSIKDLLKTNEDRILKEIDYLSKKYMLTMEQKQSVEHARIKKIIALMKPNESFQERYWNVYYFMNLYGEDLVERLLKLPIELNSNHKIVLL